MNAHDAEDRSRSTERLSQASLFVEDAAKVHDPLGDHPLAQFRDIPAVIDDRIHAFVCRLVMSGRTVFRPSLLRTQVAEALGGSNLDLVAERIAAHCGPGGLLATVLQVDCPACGFSNQLFLSATDVRSDAVLTCAKCSGDFRPTTAPEACESLRVNEEFCQYLRLVFG